MSTVQPAREPLVERDDQLAALASLAEAAARGAGGTVVIRGAPGIGKTRLLRELRARAQDAGLTTLTAGGSELERDFPFGCVRQLFAPLVPGDRARLLAGDAGLSEPVFLAPVDGEHTPHPGFGILHGLYWLTVNLSEQEPLLLALDDLHWADPPSVRYVAFLARRIEAVGVLVVVTMRQAEPGSQLQLLRQLCEDPSTVVFDLPPLSPGAVGSVVRARLDAASDRLCDLCHEATGGNPFLVGELLREIERGDPADLQRIETLGPDRVADAVLGRLDRLGPSAASLARAASVVGNGAPLRTAAALAGLDDDEAARAADALAAADILDPDRPLRFAHPIVRNAVYRRMPAAQRDQAHRRAAAELTATGAPAEAVAAHLLATEPGGRSEVVGVLREAAAAASARGALDAAVRYLERAMAEPAPPEQRAALLPALGRDAGLLGDPRALDWLREAVESDSASQIKVEAATWFSSAVAFAGRADEALAVGRRALAEADRDTEPAQRLECALLGLGQISPSTRRPVAALVRANLDAALAGTEQRPGFLANAAIECALTLGDAEQAAKLAGRAVEQGVVSDVGLDEPGPSFTLGALAVTERFEPLERLSDEVLATARARGTIRYYAAALSLRAWARFRQGRLADVRADAELYPQLLEAPVTDAMIAGPHVMALVEAGEVDRAAAIAEPLAAAPFDRSLTAYQRFAEGLAALRLAQEDPHGALAVTAGIAAWEEDIGQRSGAWSFWRLQSAQAHAALGDRGTALALAAEQVELARRFGTAGTLGTALRVLGALRADEALLAEAVGALERSAFRLEHARALFELGAAERRAKRSVRARELLSESLDRAHRCGAAALASAAQDELVAAGARPRRVTGRPADRLTPSERRVAGMAADGMSNKAIAQALFVTVDTVETHLRHAYRKLGIHSRSQLAGRLDHEGGTGSPSLSMWK